MSVFGDDDAYVASIRVSTNKQDRHGEGPGGRAVRTKNHIVIADVEHDESVAPWRDDLLARGVKAFACFPIVVTGGVFGTFSVYASSADYFVDSIVALLDEMTLDLGFALDNLTLKQAQLRSQKSLEASEARFRSAIEEAPFPVLIHAEDGEVLSCNRIWLEITGYSLAEMATIGEWTRLAYGEAKAVVQEEIDSLYDLVGRKEEGEYQIRCKNGEVRVWNFSSVALGKIADGRRIAMSMASDVTEQQQSIDQLAAAEEKFRRLVEQSVAGIFMIDEHKLIYGNPRAAEILGLENHEINNIDLEEIIDAKDLPALSKSIKDTISGDQLRARLEFNAARHRGENVRVGAQGSSAYHNGETVVLGVMQDISEKSRADAKIAKYIEQLKSAFMSTVNVAMSIGEMRDPYTAGHEREVSRIAVAIAAEMGLIEDQIEGIRVAGLLHDIGKISIPSEILAKPGRLTPTELELVKTHAQSSYELLKDVDFPWPVAEIAWEHHERMDGSGYPRGIKGPEILLEARILAVADVVEAMSSHRPYRASLGLTVALEEIRKGAGKIYDENVAAACLRLFEEKGLEINQ